MCHMTTVTTPEFLTLYDVELYTAVISGTFHVFLSQRCRQQKRLSRCSLVPKGSSAAIVGMG